MKQIRTFLMFDGRAEEAIRLYTSLFEDSEVISIERYVESGPGAAGSVKQAVFALGGREYMAIDSPTKHEFTFTPAISLFVECDSNTELERLFGELSQGGSVLMPLDSYGFSQRFGWLADRFGVSWQLNLP